MEHAGKTEISRCIFACRFMHALWDSPILGVVPAGHTILTVVLWILVFSMIRIGLKEIADKKLELTYSKENPTPS